MGFTADVAFVTAAQLAAVTHEPSLANLDDDSQATLALLLPEATNAVMRAVKRRGYNPAHVVNVDDFRAAASYWTLWTVFSALPQGDEENSRKADDYRRKWEAEVAGLVIEVDQGIKTGAAKGLPLALNLDAMPYVAGPVDNRQRAGQSFGPFYEVR